MAANSRLAVAAHIASVLASRGGGFVPSSYVAGSVNTAPSVIRRILADLTRAGIVESTEGKAGGTKLAKRPEKISLWDIAVALGEERLFAVHKNPVNPKCPISRRMKDTLGQAFAGAERAARKRLERISVKELLAGAV